MNTSKSYTFDELIDKFEGAKTVVHEYGSLALDTVNFKLNPETWSCTEVCRHLIRFNEMYLKEIKKAIDKQKTIPVFKVERSFSPKWTIKRLAALIEPPYRFGVKTIKPMKPSNVELPAAETFMRLIEINDEIVALLKNAEEERWNLKKIKGSHPLLKFYKLSFIDYLVFMDAHQRRHFWQIEQILTRIPE